MTEQPADTDTDTDIDAYADPALDPSISGPASGSGALALRANDEVDVASPPAVLTAMGFGFVPVPFLAMYAILFISRGFIVPVNPPDVTGSATGEGLVGLGAVVLIVALSLVIAWYVAARRRWPFVILQLAVVGWSVYCLADRDTGPIWIPLLMLVCSVIAIGAAFLPTSHRRFPAVRVPVPRRGSRPAASAPVESDTLGPEAEPDADSDQTSGRLPEDS